MNKVVAAMIVAGWCAAASDAKALVAVSRFDTGLDGWSLEGPGTLEWVGTGGHGGGCLKVTRTGSGELYLVAPASFHGNWAASSASPSNLRHKVSFDFQPLAGSQNRGIAYDVAGSLGGGANSTPASIVFAGRWNAVALWSWQSSPAFGDVQNFRIRLGVRAELPVDEIMLIDNIDLHTCGANCDGSTVSPVLTANDFMCYINAIAVQDPYANFDEVCGWTGNDFQTFLNAYASGCVGP